MSDLAWRATVELARANGHAVGVLQGAVAGLAVGAAATAVLIAMLSGGACP